MTHPSTHWQHKAITSRQYEGTHLSCLIHIPCIPCLCMVIVICIGTCLAMPYTEPYIWSSFYIYPTRSIFPKSSTEAISCPIDSAIHHRLILVFSWISPFTIDSTVRFPIDFTVGRRGSPGGHRTLVAQWPGPSQRIDGQNGPLRMAMWRCGTDVVSREMARRRVKCSVYGR